MFTGLIQQTGRLTAIQHKGPEGHLRLTANAWPTPIQTGESIAVQGACLTVRAHGAGWIEFDLLAETFDKTCLGDKRPGDLLNLERALRMGDPLGGHIVSGHIDGTGAVRQVTAAGRDRVVTIRAGASILQGIVPKGSVALDGISLTVVDFTTDTFTVHIIPHTWETTALCDYRVGQRVNIETDLLGKYVARYLRQAETAPPPLTLERLRCAGFLD